MTLLYNKSDMQYADYQWKSLPKDISMITVKPDNVRFNRQEGYEVLYLINSLATLLELKSRVSCLKIEKMIREKLPSNLIRLVDVKEWIRQYWNNQ